MRLTYLGTSAAEAFPAPFCECKACAQARARGGKNLRTRSQAWVNEDLLLDFPPDAYTHILQHGIDMSRINDILITHCHEDHLYLHDLLLRRPDWLTFDESRVLRVWGNDRLMRLVKSWRTESFVAEVERATFFQRVQPYVPFYASDYLITPLAADHATGEECLLYLIERDGKCLLYAHDTGFFPASCWMALMGKRLHLVSLDCNHMCDNVWRNHMGIAACAEVRDRLLSMGCCDAHTVFVLNHFSHNGQVCHEEFTELAKDEGFLVSWDGMQVQV